MTLPRAQAPGAAAARCCHKQLLLILHPRRAPSTSSRCAACPTCPHSPRPSSAAQSPQSPPQSAPSPLAAACPSTCSGTWSGDTSGRRQRAAAKAGPLEARSGSTDGLEAAPRAPGACCRGASGCGRPASAAGRPTLHRRAQGGLPRGVLPATDRRHCARGPAAPLEASPVCSPLVGLRLEQAAAMRRAVGSKPTAASGRACCHPLHLPAGGAAAAAERPAGSSPNWA